MMLVGISWAYFQFLPAIASELLKPVGEALPCLIEAKDQVGFTGPFGDSFGALTSIFSGLTLAGLITTIFLQSSELHQMQRDRKEQERAIENQAAAIKIERFENTFFQLLRMHNDIINNIEYHTGSAIHGNRTTHTGRAAFSKIIAQAAAPSSRELLSTQYETILTKVSPSEDIQAIIKSLNTLLRFVHENQSDNTTLYIEIIRSQLTKSYSFIVFLCAAFDDELKSLKSAIEQYALLENQPKELIDLAIRENIYNRTAFGKNGDQPVE